MRIVAFFILYIFFILKPQFSREQIKYIELPKDSELVARDVKTNLGDITVQGIAYRNKTPYQSVRLKIFRAAKLVRTLNQKLTYTGDSALFNFSFQIPAELKEYKISIFGVRKSEEVIDTIIHAIVAGDVFVIEGQSNALAMMRDSESANSDKNEFIRVFGSPTPDSAGLKAALKWVEARGDGDAKELGHAGQWGLRLGHLLEEHTDIPVAIFNGAYGGIPISYFERPAYYKTNLKSNYAKLYYRLRQSGLTNHVRAIIWSQGETDAMQMTNTFSYIIQFDTLVKNWKQDYPGFKKIYIFQTRSECVISNQNLSAIQEAQRELAFPAAMGRDKTDSVIEIIPTSSLREDIGGLHFAYRGGYEVFGNRIYESIAGDMYGMPTSHRVEPPNITSAYLVDSTAMVVVENTDSLVRFCDRLPILNYELENPNGAVIDTIFTNKNKIIFLLSGYPGKRLLLSYFADENDCSNWLTDSRGLELLSFGKYPVEDSITTQSGITNHISSYLKVYPKLFYDSTLVNLTIYGKYTLELEDVTGRRFLHARFIGTQYSIPAKKLAKGLYFLYVYDNKNNMVGRCKIAIVASPPPTPNPPVIPEEQNSGD